MYFHDDADGLRNRDRATHALATTNLARPAFWAYSFEAALSTFLEVVDQIPSHEPALVAGWLAAACLGLAATTSPRDVADRLTNLARKTADRIEADPEIRSTMLQVATRPQAGMEATAAKAEADPNADLEI